MSSKDITKQTALDLGLLAEEFEKIEKLLGRTPDYNELTIFAALWSEHSSYKNSIRLLKNLPREGKNIVVRAGEENAGIVDIGEDYGCVFKIESRNHPAAFDPYQGGAAGSGGIMRDIISMGARPIAQLFAACTGEPNTDKNKWYLHNIIKGVGDYNRVMGIPVTNSNLYFNDAYNTNPLVNTMSIGLVNKKEIIYAVAQGNENPVYLIGLFTGREGVNEAKYSSREITDESENLFKTGQIANPFIGKQLLEAIQELIKLGVVVGMQDIGAGGIIAALLEMAYRGKAGINVDLDRIPLSYSNMEPVEILLSQSQERMLLVGKKGFEEEIGKILCKWDLLFSTIGNVTENELVEIYKTNEKILSLNPNFFVLGAQTPVYERETKKPANMNENSKFSINDYPEPKDLKSVSRLLLKNTNIFAKNILPEETDFMAGNSNITVNEKSDAAIINLKNTNKALCATVVNNPLYINADAETGTAIAVATAARNIICSGGEPIAVTNCLNFGNPYNPEVYWQFAETIKGLTEACKKWQTPVTGGNVSFYNQTTSQGKVVPILPTPVIGMLGLIKNKTHKTGISFKSKGDMIFLIGESKNDISSSVYLNIYHKVKHSPTPHFDIYQEFELHKTIQELIQKNLVKSAHSVGMGGLFISLAESAIENELGFDVTTDSEIRTDAFLFGESQGRVVVTVSPIKEVEFIDFMMEQKFPYLALGHVTKSEMRIDDISFGFSKDIKKIYCDNTL